MLFFHLAEVVSALPSLTYIMDLLDVYESVHRNTILKVTNKMQLYRLIYFPCQPYMFGAMFSPIIRSNRLYLQYLVVFTQFAAGWCLG